MFCANIHISPILWIKKVPTSLPADQDRKSGKTDLSYLKSKFLLKRRFPA